MRDIRGGIFGKVRGNSRVCIALNYKKKKKKKKVRLQIPEKRALNGIIDYMWKTAVREG